MRLEILVTVLALSIACSTESPETDADGTWVGTITTEGDVAAATARHRGRQEPGQVTIYRAR